MSWRRTCWVCPQGASRTNTDYWESGGWEDGIYGQDQWKILSNLTINVGLRYDVSIIPVTNNVLGDYYDIFDFNRGVDIIQKDAAGVQCDTVRTLLARWDVAGPRGRFQPTGKLFFSDLTNIQPRFGASYTFHPGTVVHGGYGRTYDNWAAVEQSAQNENSLALRNRRPGNKSEQHSPG